MRKRTVLFFFFPLTVLFQEDALLFNVCSGKKKVCMFMQGSCPGEREETGNIKVLTCSTFM